VRTLATGVVFVLALTVYWVFAGLAALFWRLAGER
jgi:hypothetical protein